MTKDGVLAGFCIASCLLLAFEVGAVAASQSAMSSTEPGSSLSCSFSASQPIGYAVDFSGTIGGGTPPYKWTIHFGDGAHANGTVSSSGGSYLAKHTYSAAGTYTATFNATDSAVASAPAACSSSVKVTVQPQVKATLSDSIGVSDSAGSTTGSLLHETLGLVDAASSSAGVVLRETLGLTDAIGLYLSSTLTETIGVTGTVGTGTSTTGTTASSTGGGVPEFPRQVLVTALFALFLTLSYFIARPSARRQDLRSSAGRASLKSGLPE